jgi:hypothetical protein
MEARINQTDPAKNSKFRLDELVDESLKTPTLAIIIEEFEGLLDKKFEKKLPETLSKLVLELNLEFYIDEAIQIAIREYQRQYFTIESA